MKLLSKLVFVILLWQQHVRSVVKSQTCLSHIVNELNTEDNVLEIKRQAKAADAYNYMDTTKDPCVDFYAYACGKWARINPADTMAKTGFVSVLRQAYDRRLQRFLNAGKSSNENSAALKVKYFYEACLAEYNNSGQWRAALLALLDEYGGMPAVSGQLWRGAEFDWLKTVAVIQRKYNLKILINVHIFIDFWDNTRMRLYIGPPKIADHTLNNMDTIKTKLQQLLNLNENAAASTAADIIDFETKLFADIEAATNETATTQNWQLQMLDNMSAVYGPTLNFTRFMRHWLGHEYLLPVYATTTTYHRRLKALIESTPKAILANYIMWQLLQLLPINSAHTTYAEQQKYCLQMTKHYFVAYFDQMVHQQLLNVHENLETEVQLLWLELKWTMREILAAYNMSWMSVRSLVQALDKLNLMTLDILSYESLDFEAEYAELVISNADFFQNILNVHKLQAHNYRLRLWQPTRFHGGRIRISPSYVLESNKILLPVAFLQPHFLWDPAYPVALKYATLGYAIAHELAHGFDGNGAKFDAVGNLFEWWDSVTRKSFGERENCLRQHYAAFKSADQQPKEDSSQIENTADNIGLSVAYTAYDNWLSKQQHAESLVQERLPLLDLEPRQLFFIGISQFWCADIHKDMRAILYRTDNHAPEAVRVNGMLSNFEPFNKAFKCEVGSAMNPANKCAML